MGWGHVLYCVCVCSEDAPTSALHASLKQKKDQSYYYAVSNFCFVLLIVGRLMAEMCILSNRVHVFEVHQGVCEGVGD